MEEEKSKHQLGWADECPVVVVVVVVVVDDVCLLCTNTECASSVKLKMTISLKLL